MRVGEFFADHSFEIDGESLIPERAAIAEWGADAVEAVPAEHIREHTDLGKVERYLTLTGACICNAYRDRADHGDLDAD